MNVGSREDLELAGGQPEDTNYYAFRPAHELLAIAVTITGTFTPTSEALTDALAEVGGPALAHVLAWGWMVPTPDKKGLRWPPVPPAELWGGRKEGGQS